MISPDTFQLSARDFENPHVPPTGLVRSIWSLLPHHVTLTLPLGCDTARSGSVRWEDETANGRGSVNHDPSLLRCATTVFSTDTTWHPAVTATPPIPAPLSSHCSTPIRRIFAQGHLTRAAHQNRKRNFQFSSPTGVAHVVGMCCRGATVMENAATPNWFCPAPYQRSNLASILDQTRLFCLEGDYMKTRESTWFCDQH